MRVKNQVVEMKEKGVELRFVLGIDLGGTSQEVGSLVFCVAKFFCSIKQIEHIPPRRGGYAGTDAPDSKSRSSVV